MWYKKKRRASKTQQNDGIEDNIKRGVNNKKPTSQGDIRKLKGRVHT